MIPIMNDPLMILQTLLAKYRTSIVSLVLCKKLSKFGYTFKTCFYFIARYTLILPVVAPMLSRVT